MLLKVLGCSGGIGQDHGQIARTTSFLLDEDILIDAGTGVEDLSVDELTLIDHVFLTHSHLDHIAALPLMVDSVGNRRDKPLVVHALPETIAALKTHIFNWVIWPDFTEIPHYDRPWMRFEPLTIGATVEIPAKNRPSDSVNARANGPVLSESRFIRSLAANHTVPALAFHIKSRSGSIVYSGDNVPTDDFWSQVNGIQDLKTLIIETAFSNREQDLAVTSKHMYPIALGDALAKLQMDAKIYLTHFKPADRVTIETEVQAWAGRYNPHILRRGDCLEI
jgi:ribonuclease BN (tRNA processing enzyme)